LTPEELRALLTQPEGQRLEFKRNIPRDPSRLAELGGAFANTAGGTLVIGFDEPSREVVGLARPERDLERLRKAFHLVQPPIAAEPEIVELNGRSLIVAKIEKGEGFPYVAGGRVVEREGKRVRPVSADLVVRRVQESTTPVAVEQHAIAIAIELQGQKIDQLAEAASWRKQLPVQLVFLVAGVILGYVMGGWNPFGF
jgi:predicted HTH transcriptional regulator